MHVGTPVPRDLQHDRGGGPEAVEAQPEPGRGGGGDAGDVQRPVADDAAAQQRRHGRVALGRVRRAEVGQREGHVGSRDDVGGVAAVAVPPGEGRLLAEVLAPLEAEAAATAGAGEPDQADALAEPDVVDPDAHGLHRAHDLVARHHGEPVGRQVPAHQLQVGAAHGTGGHAHEHLGRPRLGIGALARAQGSLQLGTRGVQLDGAHGTSMHRLG